jgi:hypothetical protein
MNPMIGFSPVIVMSGPCNLVSNGLSCRVALLC